MYPCTLCATMHGPGPCPGFKNERKKPAPNSLVVTYKVPDDAPEWFFQCAADGDWNGMLEYAMTLRADSVLLT